MSVYLLLPALRRKAFSRFERSGSALGGRRFPTNPWCKSGQRGGGGRNYQSASLRRTLSLTDSVLNGQRPADYESPPRVGSANERPHFVGRGTWLVSTEVTTTTSFCTIPAYSHSAHQQSGLVTSSQTTSPTPDRVAIHVPQIRHHEKMKCFTAEDRWNGSGGGGLRWRT